MIVFPPNFAQVVPGLTRSGTPVDFLSSAKRRAFAEALGLRTVVRLVEEEPDVSWAPGVLATSLPAVKPVMTRTMWARWRELLEDQSRWPIHFYCHMGAERTGVYAAHAETYLGHRKSKVRARLHKHGETFWSRDRDVADRQHLLDSLRSLRRTGDVLDDDRVAEFLRRRYAVSGVAPDAWVESEVGWTPRPPFKN